MSDEATQEIAASGAATEAARRISEAQWALIRRVVLVLFAAALVLQIAVGIPPADRGVPLSPYLILVWLGAGSAIWSLGRDRREIVYAFFGWGALAFAILAYSRTRSVVDNWWPARTTVPGHPRTVPTASVDNARWIIAVDRVLGFGRNPTVALQDHLYVGNKDRAPVWEAFPALVYLSHFFVVYVVAIIQWVKDRREWLRWTLTLTALLFLGVILYMLVPTAPPWLAAPLDLIGPVERTGTRGLARFNLDVVRSLFEKGAASANEVAAFPSLHTGFTALVSAYFWRTARPWLRAVLVAYPLSMTFALVYGGEHYIFDCICGGLLAVFTVWLCRRVERWWVARRGSAQPLNRNASSSLVNSSDSSSASPG